MNQMKTRSLIAIVALLALLATACGGGTETATEAVEVPDEAEQLAEAETTTETPESSTEAPETSTEAPAEPEEEAPAEPEEEPAGEIDPATVDGMELYESNCARCHSGDGSGGRGANLQGIAVEQPDTAAGIEIVTNGGDGMPDFADDLTPEQIEAVINYVWETF